MAETRSTTRPAGAQPAPTEGGANLVEGNTTPTTTPNAQPGDTSSQDGDSDVEALDAESVPSTRYSTSLRQMMDSMYDDFKLNTGPDLENFEDLLKQFNHFMKFQASVMVACNFVYSRTDSSSISALGAEMLTKAIMQKLEVEADSEWEGWKRNLCEAARTKKELTQALWRVELTLPEALLAKLYAMYHPGIVAGDVVGTTTPKQYYEDLRKMPFHHVMHEILTPLIIIGTWKDVRILGGKESVNGSRITQTIGGRSPSQRRISSGLERWTTRRTIRGWKRFFRLERPGRYVSVKTTSLTRPLIRRGSWT